MRSLITAFLFVPAAVMAGPAVDFLKQVQPVLAVHCVKCHGPEKQKGGLRLDNRRDAFAGGEDAKDKTIVPRDSANSDLYKRLLTADADERMPKKKEALPAAQIALIKRWIDEGAVWPESGAATPAPAVKKEMVVTEEDRKHWAFAPLRAAPPRSMFSFKAAASNSIDGFITAKLAEKKLSLSPPVDRRREIRRVCFDLTGLPPTPEQIEAYVKDVSPTAYGKLVDSLLANPHYGERWGRIWLDLARYADSEGYENDKDRKEAWRYRDFVIGAWNEDMPFDQFVRWQLAGDEIAPDDPRAITATGFLTAGPFAETVVTDLPENKAKVIYDNLDDIVATTGSTMLGVTIGCARCHDHKFDPVPTRDYYRLSAAFTSIERGEFSTLRPQRELDRFLDAQRDAWKEAKMAELNVPDSDRIMLRVEVNPNNQTHKAAFTRWEKKLAVTPEELRAWLKSDTRTALEAREKKAALSGSKSPPKALAVVDQNAEPAKSFLLTRGDAMHRQEEVTLGFLQVLTGKKKPEDYLVAARKSPTPGSTMQRTALANWMTDADDGAGRLVARVIVNRLWQHHFGEGLVRTPGDFGTQGDLPTHPELLDWLAGELIRGGWKLKPVQRAMVLSAAYRQDTTFDEANSKMDPDNLLLGRQRPQRLDAEIIRDSILAVSGVLNDTPGGPSFKSQIPKEAMVTRTKDAYPDNIADAAPVWRRSVYQFAKRSVRHPFMEVFDAPDAVSSCSRRSQTTVPTQMLALMNDGFIRRRAANFAERISREAGAETKAQIPRAFELALGRAPSADELSASVAFIEKQTLVDFCHALFTLNEFIHVD